MENDQIDVYTTPPPSKKLKMEKQTPVVASPLRRSPRIRTPVVSAFNPAPLKPKSTPRRKAPRPQQPDISLDIHVNSISLDDCRRVMKALLDHSNDRNAFIRLISPSTLSALFSRTANILRNRQPIEEVNVPFDERVCCIGDIHGQFHDLCSILSESNAGFPAQHNTLVFTGDYVDRGAWGLECVTILSMLKCADPDRIILLRGNHETSYCIQNYGFKKEVMCKLESIKRKTANAIMQKIQSLFRALPLAGVINKRVFCVHGGMFRQPDGELLPCSSISPSSNDGKLESPLFIKTDEHQNGDAADHMDESVSPDPSLDDSSDLDFDNFEMPGMMMAMETNFGTVQDLKDTAKNKTHIKSWRGSDPQMDFVEDLLWSDPAAHDTDGKLKVNVSRGAGMMWGPDVTQKFLKASGLGLMIRSHEGPDARVSEEERPGFESMDKGFTVDHSCEDGQLITIFSAPDYPQFQWDAEKNCPAKQGSHLRHNNKGSYVSLEFTAQENAPAQVKAVPHTYEAQLRPAIHPEPPFHGAYYEFQDLMFEESDEEEGEHSFSLFQDDSMNSDYIP